MIWSVLVLQANFPRLSVDSVRQVWISLDSCNRYVRGMETCDTEPFVPSTEAWHSIDKDDLMTHLRPLIDSIFPVLCGISALCLCGEILDAAPPQKLKIFIAYENQPGPADIALVQTQGGKVKWAYKTVPVLAAEVPQTALKGIVNNPGVIFIEPDLKVRGSDAELDKTWGVKHIGAGPVHDSGFKGTGVKVAVLDTGIDYNHPDLVDRYAGGYDFVNNDNDPLDDHGHGTHVSGTIAASQDGLGVVGVAPEVQIYALKVLDSTAWGYWSDIAAGVEWCIQNKIQVTNNSYGDSSNPGVTLKTVFENADAAGVLNVASAGNDGSGTDTVEYPARWPTLIAVSATTSSDTLASFSSTGPDIELCAPGTPIYSTVPGGGYQYWEGTSMACPHVVGSAAVLFGIGAVDNNGNGRINDDIRQILNLSAVDLGPVGRDNDFGNGLVNVDLAVMLNGDPPPPQDPPPAQDPPPSSTLSMSVASISYNSYGGKSRDKHLDVIIKIVDENSLAVPSADVTAKVTGSNGSSYSFNGTTDDTGTVVFSVKNAGKGSWMTTVNSVSASGYQWDGLNGVSTFSN